MLLAAAPRRAHRPYPSSDGGGAHRIWFFVEDHGEVILPLLGLAILALLVWVIRRGMSTNVAELQKKQDQKDAIVRMTRSRLRVDAENVAAELQTDRLQAGALLDELVKEGMLVEQRVTGGTVSYRLKGA